MKELFEVANSLTPLGLCGILAYMLWLQIKSKKIVNSVANNHLSGLPDMQGDIKTLVAQAEIQTRLLQVVANDLAYLKGRVNGGAS